MNDTFWRLEQVQTRVRIQKSQVQFWGKMGCCLWLLCAAMVFLLGLSRYDRSSVTIWVMSSWTPLRTVKWQGAWYNADELSHWLSEDVYNGTPKEWILWALGVGFFPVGASGLVFWWYMKQPEPQEEHVRGTELVQVDELRSRLRKVGKGGVTVAGVSIPEELHRQHFLFSGATGTGKTTAERGLLREVEQRREPCVVVDPEGEFVREFYNPERGDWLLNPLDARWPGWDLRKEYESEEDIEALAASLFPITSEMKGAEVYYRSDARILFRKILPQVADPRDIPQLLDDMSEASKSQTQRSLISTLRIACDCFRHLHPGERQWSAREWAKERHGWIFLTFRETEKDAVLPILSLWLDSLSRRLLNDELNPEETTWIVIDELAVLKAQPNLQQILNRGRKRGVAVVLGFQDVLQLYAIYGKEMASNMLDQPKTRLLLGNNSAETQRWCSGDIGRREVERQSESETVGPENVRDTIGRSRPRREEPAVMGSEFGSLPDLHGYLKVRPHGVARVQVPYVAMKENQPAFIRREAAQEVPEKQEVSKKRRLL